MKFQDLVNEGFDLLEGGSVAEMNGPTAAPGEKMVFGQVRKIKRPGSKLKMGPGAFAKLKRKRMQQARAAGQQ